MSRFQSLAPPQFASGFRALPLRLRFMLSLGKYAFRKRKFPLFTLSPSRRGLVASRLLLRELALCKSVWYDHQVRFSLTVPRWPSRPFDQMVARGGLNITASGTPLKQQIDMAILGITRKCAYSCRHCYEHFNLAEEESVPVERWATLVREIQEVGVSVVVFSGGEPMMRFADLLSLLRSVDQERSEFHVHTSGHGVSRERARALKTAGLAAAAVGLDDIVPERHDAMRGTPGSFGEAIQALDFFREAGIFTYLNTCLTKDIVRSGDLPRLLLAARDLGVGIVRILEPRPCGTFLDADPEDLFSAEDRAIVTEFFREANLGPKYRDCPLISYEAYFEAPERLGCMMGGHSHLYIDSRGHVEPCVFLPVSFGNIIEEDFASIFARMRARIPRPLHDRCPSVQLVETIRTKGNNGSALPLTIETIQAEWEDMMRWAQPPFG